VLSVGFGAGARAELVAAVSNAGGFGVLGASGMAPERVRAEVERTRESTARPFGINVIVAEDPEGDVEEDRGFVRSQIAAAAQAGASAVVLFWGDAVPYVGSAHAEGVSVLIQVGSVPEAEAAVYDLGWPTAPHRTLRNRNYAEWVAAGRPRTGRRPGEGTSIGRRESSARGVVEWPRYAVGMATSEFDGDIEYAPLWAGESCSVINDIKPAGDIVRGLSRDAETALAAESSTSEG
jgi:NAD(P)H-dependent flavin oxidoreductase YrpB (nitropropane dioxygenase family)